MRCGMPFKDPEKRREYQRERYRRDPSKQRAATAKSGAVRGLLCSNCNRAIGYLKDSVEIVEAAVSYLAKWKAQS